MSAAFVLRMFGALRLDSGTEDITKFPTQRSALILARLATARGSAVSRDELAEQLWPNDFQDQTRLRLRQELKRLRQSIGTLGSHIRADRQWVELESGCLETDVQMFDQAIARSEATDDVSIRLDCLSQAVALINGPFLVGYSDPWVIGQRREYEDKARRAWLGLADTHQSLGYAEEALRATMTAVRHAPLDIAANAALIRRYFDGGQLSRARQTFFDFDAMTFRELGRHAPTSLRAIIEGVSAERVEDAPVSSAPRGGVPRPAPLHGRAELLESVQSALSHPGACVVLVGTVGVGKSHIAKESAWQFARTHGLPVCFEECPDSVEDGLFLPRAITGPELLESVQSAAHRGWRVLAESRVRLNSDSVMEILVNPLVPPAESAEPVELRADPSIQILMSKLGGPSAVTPHEADLRELGELARRLDGIPGALKLFAARLTFQTPGQALAGLQEGLDEHVSEELASGGTMVSAVSAVCQDLPDKLRHFFEGLIWLDGASADLAMELAAPANPSEALSAMEQRCLITVVDTGPRRRYRVSAPVTWAVRRGTTTARSDAAKRRLWNAVASWAYKKSRQMGGPNQEYAFNAVEAELPNLMTGLEWATAHDNEIAGRLVLGSWRTVCARGNPATQAMVLFLAVNRAHREMEEREAGEAWLGAAVALSNTRYLPQSWQSFDHSMFAYRQAGDWNGHAWAAMNYAGCIVAKDDMPKAMRITKEAIDETTDTNVRAMGLSFYAMGLADMGETAEALRVGEENFARRLQSDDETEQARAYADLAGLYRKVGRPEAADPLLREGVRRLREAGIQDILLDTLLLLIEAGLNSDDLGPVIAEADILAGRIGSNVKRLQVARARMAWASIHGHKNEFVAAIEDTFRFTQISESPVERGRSLRALAVELGRQGKHEYANAIFSSVGDFMATPINFGWDDLLSSESHATICVLAVVMAKEALRG